MISQNPRTHSKKKKNPWPPSWSQKREPSKAGCQFATNPCFCTLNVCSYQGFFLDCTSLQWFFDHPWSRNHRISWQDDTKLWILWERETRSLRLRNCMLEDGCQEGTSHHHHQRRPPIDFFLWTRVVRISFFLRTPALLETCLRWVLTQICASATTYPRSNLSLHDPMILGSGWMRWAGWVLAAGDKRRNWISLNPGCRLPPQVFGLARIS